MNVTPEVYNLAYSCLIDGAGEKGAMTPALAEYTIKCWRDEGSNELADTPGLTPEAFAAAWNSVLEQFHANECNQSSKAAQEIARVGQMKRVARMAMDMLRITRPNHSISIEYVNVTDDNVDRYTDWQRKRNGIGTGNEYFIVWDENPDWDAPSGRDLLYAVNVTYDSILTAASELMNLLSRKF